MKIKELIQILKKLPPDAVIDIASDEEGNSFGDIDQITEGKLKNGKTVFTLYPLNTQLYEDRYKDECTHQYCNNDAKCINCGEQQ